MPGQLQRQQELGLDVAAGRVEVEGGQGRSGGTGAGDQQVVDGVDRASKNRPSRSELVTSKAAMLALSSRPTRCRRSGSRAVRIRSAPLARASRAVSSPMPELPPITTTV
jgi:hypothetical protein